MTLLTRDWTATVLNNVPSQATLAAQGAAVLFARKTQLVAQGFVCQGSSNSSAAAMDATDRWITAANIVYSAAGARSWWVGRIQVTTGNFIYVLLAASVAAGSENLASITWSSAAFTGSSTTADPTTTASRFRTFASKQMLRTPVANSKFHLIRSTSGDGLFLVSADGSGRFIFGSMAVFLANAIPTLNFPFFVIESYSDVGSGAFTLTNLQGTTNTVAWNNDGTVTTGQTGVAGLFIASGVDAMLQITNSGSGVDGSFPDVAAVVWGGSAGSASVGAIGTLPDIALAPSATSVTQGTEEPPAPAASTTMIAAAFWVPNDGQTALL